MALLKELIEKLILKNSADDKKARKITQQMSINNGNAQTDSESNWRNNLSAIVISIDSYRQKLLIGMHCVYMLSAVRSRPFIIFYSSVND